MSQVRVNFDERGEVVECELGPPREDTAPGPSVDELVQVMRETDPGPAKDDRHFKPTVSDDEAARGWKAMMLAKDIETCRALLSGESVPDERLRPEWIARFGRRGDR
jgi:hypothetical protein